MRLSVENETFLKNNINSNDKNTKINTISGKIEQLEKEMNLKFGKGYLDVIDKCTVLEKLQSNVEIIKNSNIELLNYTQDTIIRQSSLIEELQLISRSLERLKIVHKEIAMILEFLEMALKVRDSFESPSDIQDGYSVVSSIFKMSEIYSYFKRYSFFPAMNSIYISLHCRFLNELADRAKEYLRRIDFSKIAIKNDKFEIFDPRGVLRREFINVEFLEIFYAAEKLNFIADMTETFNAYLMTAIADLPVRDSTRSKEVIEGVMGIIMIQNYFGEFYPGIRVCTDEIFDKLSLVQFDNVFSFVPLKRIAVLFKIDCSKLDQVIETGVFRYLQEKNFAVDLEIREFVRQLGLFVEKNIKFLLEISQLSNELDEIFCKKIDNIMVDYLNSNKLNNPESIMNLGSDKKGTLDCFVMADREFNAIIENIKEIKPFFRGFDFYTIELLQSIEKKLVDQKYEEIAGICNKQKIPQIIPALVALKNFINPKCTALIIGKIQGNTSVLLKDKSETDIVLFKDAIKRNFPGECSK
jgi:hypothetical protein